jgi:hypothetical protein
LAGTPVGGPRSSAAGPRAAPASEAHGADPGTEVALQIQRAATSTGASPPGAAPGRTARRPPVWRAPRTACDSARIGPAEGRGALVAGLRRSEVLVAVAARAAQRSARERRWASGWPPPSGVTPRRGGATARAAGSRRGQPAPGAFERTTTIMAVLGGRRPPRVLRGPGRSGRHHGRVPPSTRVGPGDRDLPDALTTPRSVGGNSRSPAQGRVPGRRGPRPRGHRPEGAPQSRASPAGGTGAAARRGAPATFPSHDRRPRAPRTFHVKPRPSSRRSAMSKPVT